MPFGEVLETNFLVEILEKASSECRDRIFPPTVTLAAFLSQVLSEDHSCREAVARVISERMSSKAISSAGWISGRGIVQGQEITLSNGKNRPVDNDKIAENDYNLSVSSYVEAKDNCEVIDITKLNAEIKTTVAKIDRCARTLKEVTNDAGK